MKKGESISMSVIIIAAIALLVLVVLAVLVLQTGGKVKDGTSCRGFGGVCKDTCDSSYEGTDFAHRGDCPEDTPSCCIPISKQPE
jgi:hypothetical protein